MKLKFEDGVYDISNKDYHNSSGISRSQLMHLDKSPMHYHYEVLSGNAEKKESTTAMRFGSLFHCLLLEPCKVNHEFHIISQKTLPYKGSNSYNEMIEKACGREVVTQDQVRTARAMVESVMSNPECKILLEDSEFEKSIFWTDKESGVQFKSRPDIWSENIVVDVKTTSDLNAKAMERASLSYGYYLQAGMAYEACKVIGSPINIFIILACEKEAPYGCCPIIMKDEAMQFGVNQFHSYKRKLMKSHSANDWHGYKAQEIGVPRYAAIMEEEY